MARSSRRPGISGRTSGDADRGRDCRNCGAALGRRRSRGMRAVGRNPHEAGMLAARQHQGPHRARLAAALVPASRRSAQTVAWHQAWTPWRGHGRHQPCSRSSAYGQRQAVMSARFDILDTPLRGLQAHPAQADRRRPRLPGAPVLRGRTAGADPRESASPRSTTP